MNIDSIIFDLDGTLWDSTDILLKAWNNTIKEYKVLENGITKEDIKSVMGLQIEDIGRKFFPNLSEDTQKEILKKCCEDECKYLCEHGGKLYDDLEKTLKVLAQKYKLFIVSNCECGYIESFYKFHKLDKYFIDFENPGRTGLTKGENIKLIIERNNLTNPIYVGDTMGDLKASRFAGIPFVYARYGFGDVKDYDYVIDGFEELLELVRS